MKQLSLLLKSNQPNLDATIIRSGIRFYSQYCFKIPAPIVENYFSTYNLLYWSAKHTYHRIIEGFIIQDGIKYKVIYKGMNRGQLLSIIQNDCGAMQIPLSFRKPKPEYDLPAIVILGTCETA